MTNERARGGARVVVAFAAAAVAMVFLNVGTAGAQDTTSTQDASNNASGSAALTSGDAGAGGNTSNTAAQGSGNGKVTITNSGSANANSGGNTATGNSIDNNLSADQSDSGGTKVNTQAVDNEATGAASVSTGDARATGNQATTQLTQSSSGDGDITQSALIENVGTASATSGENTAIGNDVVNTLDVDQSDDLDANGVAISINAQAVENELDGTAAITTGDAAATGNTSSTSVSQLAVANGGHAGGNASVNQSATVVNHGEATADTGSNVGIGNDVDNSLNALQDVSIRGPPAGAVIVTINTQAVDNELVGSAAITTGDANVRGNTSVTLIDQRAKAIGFDAASVTQDADVTNTGAAVGITGQNIGIGNAVDNDLDADQAVDIDDWAGTGDLVIVLDNVQGVDNEAVGTASIATGDVDGLGITGRNIGIGNDVGNGLDVDQGVDADALIGAVFGDIIVVPSNAQAVDNDLVGTASIVTGDAAGTANDA